MKPLFELPELFTLSGERLNPEELINGPRPDVLNSCSAGSGTLNYCHPGS